MAETVLVTGGTGFIAGWCIVELLRRGYAVRTTVRDASKETAFARLSQVPAPTEETPSSQRSPTRRPASTALESTRMLRADVRPTRPRF